MSFYKFGSRKPYKADMSSLAHGVCSGGETVHYDRALIHTSLRVKLTGRTEEIGVVRPSLGRLEVIQTAVRYTRSILLQVRPMAQLNTLRDNTPLTISVSFRGG